MSGPITVLWLVDEQDVPPKRDGRFRHVVGDPSLPGATITGLLAEGAVLAVVRTDEEGQRAIAYGADEVILASEAAGESFEKVVERTTARARARVQRDMFLIDLVRRDDTAALELLAAALGEEIVDPLARVTAESKELSEQISGAEPARRANAIAETIRGVANVVERMRDLVNTQPTDEVVDLAEVTREVARTLGPGVRPVAELEVRIVERACRVGMPRWQAALMVASLLENAVESVAARGGAGRKVSVRVSVQEGAAVLEVADDGVGMGEDDRAYAADPFFTTQGKGRLGLGLTLVTARLRRVGGALVIESDKGVGTTVRAFLPLVGGTPDTPPSN
ncbi:MAG: sensor histidine kinase [Polyangiaceae bacterium]